MTIISASSVQLVSHFVDGYVFAKCNESAVTTDLDFAFMLLWQSNR